jgi:alpha-2-macroglobulin
VAVAVDRRPEIRAEIERLLLNSATETAGAATFATSYSEAAYVIAVSDRRTDGVILDALISQAPQSDLIPKVVAGLLAQQTRGHWNSAQDNAFVLVAMRHYFEQFENATPELVARAWLGTTYVLEQPYSGRTTDRATTVVPMSDVVALPADQALVIQKEGLGRLYYRLGMRYAPADLALAARDEGFVVERIYEAIDDPADVTRDPDGTWRIRSGAAVRVTVTMVADARRTHVALVDPLPAGLEPVNPALAVSQTFAPDETGDETGDEARGDDWCWCWRWFEHQNLRDDRAEAFTSFLGGGTYEYRYVARATTPGRFVVPPATAEELFAPEVFGRSASATSSSSSRSSSSRSSIRPGSGRLGRCSPSGQVPTGTPTASGCPWRSSCSRSIRTTSRSTCASTTRCGRSVRRSTRSSTTSRSSPRRSG